MAVFNADAFNIKKHQTNHNAIMAVPYRGRDEAGPPVIASVLLPPTSQAMTLSVIRDACVFVDRGRPMLDARRVY